MNPDHEHRPASDRRPGRPWGRLAAGTTAAAAVLGVGAYVVTDRTVNQESQSIAPEIRPAAPAPTTPLPEGPSRSPKPDATVKPDNKSPAEPPTTRPDRQGTSEEEPPETSDDVKKRITAARETAEKAGFPLQRPLEPTGTVAGVTSETTQRLPDGTTLRITTANRDLSGQRPLLWAADDGEPRGNSLCTQKFRFSQSDSGHTRPTMLMCWRTSADRSVAVLAVAPTGTPSRQATTKVVDREWKKLS
jgi:hypothetical protein